MFYLESLYNSTPSLWLNGSFSSTVSEDTQNSSYLLHFSLAIICISCCIDCCFPRGPLRGRVSKSQPERILDWNAFREYVVKHSQNDPKIEPEEALELARNGIELLQNIKNNEYDKDKEFVQTERENEFCSVVWGLMLHAISKNEGFIEGTFCLVDEDYRIFDYFQHACYKRGSSHYCERSIGRFEWGCDVGLLPADKRSILMNKISSKNGKQLIYIKPENFGCNLNFLTDPKARTAQNLLNTIGHGIDYLKTRGEKKEGEGLRKEHFPESLKEEATALKKRVDKVSADYRDWDLKEWGFTDVVPFFEKAIAKESVREGLRTEIKDFLKKIEDSYDHFDFRKGEEIAIQDSIHEWVPRNIHPPREIP